MRRRLLSSLTNVGSLIVWPAAHPSSNTTSQADPRHTLSYRFRRLNKAILIGNLAETRNYVNAAR